MRDRRIQNPLGIGDVVALGVILLALVLSGCASTITPAPVTRAGASWDGTNLNSGFLAFTNGGALITGHARERYNALVAQYGARFQPALKMDAGVIAGESQRAEGNTYWIDAEHLQAFATMNRWRRGEGP